MNGSRKRKRLRVGWDFRYGQRVIVYCGRQSPEEHAEIKDKLGID